MTARYLTASDLGDLIRVDRSTIYRMAESGRLPAVKVGRQWRFPADDVQRWLDGEPSRADSSHGGAFRAPVTGQTAQALAALFAELNEVMVVVTDMEGRPVMPIVNACGFFAAAAGSPNTIERCAAEWRALAGEYDFVPRLRESHLGLLCARAFVRNGNELAGMALAGGIAPEGWPPEPSRLVELAEATGSDPMELAKHVEEVHRLDACGQESLLEGLSQLASHLSRLPTGANRVNEYQRSQL